MNRITICVPLYNGAPFVAALLRSIQAQTFRDFRVVLADDASTDATLQVVEPFLADPRFELVKRPANLGFNKNLNQLLRDYRDTDYLALPGQDDVWTPSFLENHIRFLDQHPRAGFVHSRSLLMDENGRPIDASPWYWQRLTEQTTGQELIEALLTHNFICLPATVIRRAALDEVWREFQSREFTFVPDWWLWLLLAGRGWDCGYLAEPDCHYRLHSGQLTQTLKDAAKTSELSLVLADFTRLLDGENFGRGIPEARRATLRHLAHARLLRRGLALMLRRDGHDGWQLVKIAARHDPLCAAAFPFFLARYALAKLRRHHNASGIIELFHPLAADP